MGRTFLLAFCTLSALFLTTLHARLDPFSADSNHVLVRSRALQVQHPDPDKRIADPPAERESPDEEGRESAAAAEGPGGGEKERHHSRDKSVAGGGVIIGGLVTAIFAAVYCYIRVTRKRAAQHLK